MPLREIREATILRALAGALGVWLLASVGTFAADHSAIIVQPKTPLAANPGVDSACQPVMDAGDKLFTTPYHMFGTEGGAGAGGKKPASSEMIFAGGVQYVLYNGKWSKSPISAEESKAMVERNKKTAKTSCHYVRDESVNGESAALYSTHDITPHGTVDSQIWVSKSRGLILRQDMDIDTGGGHKTHLSTHYEYSNVQAPKL